MTVSLIILIALPAVAGVALLLGGSRLDRAAPTTAIAVAAVTVVLAITVAITRPSVDAPFIDRGGATLAVDGLTAVLVPTIAAVALLVVIFAVAERTRPEGRFHGLMLVFVAAVLVTVTSTSLVSLLAAWEIMGATSYALIGFHWQNARTIPAGFVAFLVTRTADLGLYVAAGAALAAGVGWRLDELSNAASPWLSILAAGVLVAGLGKAAQLPFSFWLSRAMNGPSSVSALLHSAAMVAMGGYLLLRLSPLLQASGWAMWAAAWIGAATAIVLGLVALGQSDLKQLLAASTASQLGFVVLAAGIGATAGGAAQLMAHAATKALLFLVAGAWLAATGTQQLQALRGVGRHWRIVGVTVLIGALALAGLPPFALWLTKDAVLTVALEVSPALYAAGLVAAVLSAAYSAKILAAAWAPPRNGHEKWSDAQPHGTRGISAATVSPLIILAAGAIGLAVVAVPGLDWGFRDLLGASAQPQSTLWELAASAGLALIVTAVALRHRLPTVPGSERWFGLEHAAVKTVSQPIDALAIALARFDDGLDRVVERSGPGLRAFAARMGRGDYRLDGVVDATPSVLGHTSAITRSVDARVDDTVARLARATGTAARLARRSQSGRIADYYAVGAVITVMFVVVLVLVR